MLEMCVCVRAFSRVLSWMEKCVYLLGEGGGEGEFRKRNV